MSIWYRAYGRTLQVAAIIGGVNAFALDKIYTLPLALALAFVGYILEEKAKDD